MREGGGGEPGCVFCDEKKKSKDVGEHVEKRRKWKRRRRDKVIIYKGNQMNTFNLSSKSLNTVSKRLLAAILTLELPTGTV